MCDTTVYIDKAGQMEEVLKVVVSLAKTNIILTERIRRRSKK